MTSRAAYTAKGELPEAEADTFYSEKNAHHPSSEQYGDKAGIKDDDSEKAHYTTTQHVDTELMYLHEVPPEVKAVVPDTDDVDESCETFRAYFLGTICAVIGTGLNTCTSYLSLASVHGYEWPAISRGRR